MIRLRHSLGLLLAWSTIAQWLLFMDYVTVSSFTATTPSSARFVVRQQHNFACEVVGMVQEHRRYQKQQRQQHSNKIQRVSSNTIGRIRSISSNRCSALCMLPCDITSSASTLLTSVVEYFDGSTIIDPVVVSNVFWSRIQANIISVIIGQFLAAIVFSFLLSTAASQITKLLSYVSDQIVTTTTTQRENQPPLRIPRDMREEASTASAVQPDLGKLLICVLIDMIGSSSLLLPLIGDASDILWAPTAGLLLRYLFYNSNIILVFEFAEEILPFTDIIPLATLCWIIDTYFRETDIAKLLQLGAYSSSSSVSDKDRSDAIDVDSNIQDGRSNTNKLDRM